MTETPRETQSEEDPTVEVESQPDAVRATEAPEDLEAAIDEETADNEAHGA